MKHSEIESIPDSIHKQMNFMSEIKGHFSIQT